MNLFVDEDDVRCEACGGHPNYIIWDFSFEEDARGMIHTDGKYICQCGHEEVFPTNNPNEDAESI